MTRREWLTGSSRFAAGAAIAPSLASCGRSMAHQSPGNPTVTVLYPYDEMVLAPGNEMPAQFLVFLPLVAWNRRSELEGRLAERWEHSPDFRTWTIRLRDGIRWHDGVPVTAQDMKFTLDLLTHPDVMAFAPGSVLVEVIDRLTYKLTCTRNVSWGTPLDDWTIYLPKHVVENFDPKGYWDWDFWTHPVGNGPYHHHRTVPKTMMEFKATPDYYWGKPKIERVVLKLAGDTMATGVPELLSGGVDAVAYLKRADVLKLAGDPRFRAYSQLHNEGVNVLFWNHRNELFRDPKVRRALTLGINRRELMQVLNFPGDTPVLDSLFSARQMRRHEFPEPVPYDPVLASHMLDEAGWQERTGEGWRKRNGKPFTFTALNGSDGGDPGAGVYVQAQLRRLGIRMNLDTHTGGFERVITGDYEAAVNFMFMGWGPGNGPERFLHAAGYQSSQFAQIANKLRAAFDPNQEDRLYHELGKLFQEDLPATFLYPDVLTTVASTRIRGLKDAPYRGDLTWCMDQLSLQGQE